MNSTGQNFETVTSFSDIETAKPFMFKVLLHNDDYTPMDFVVLVLKKYFDFPQNKAEEIMLNVHFKGIGICGVFTKEIAETKVHQVIEFARNNSHPLKCTMEKDI